jgi:chorismate mutase/prephenate dehydratase
MPDSPPDEAAQPLDSLRAQVDRLDEQIVQLLNERARVVVQIGQIKQRSGSPIYAPDREKAVLERLHDLNRGPLPDRALDAVYRELMSGSFALEKPLRIGYLGPEGSFSHAAAARQFGNSVDYVPLTDIQSVFAEVARTHIDYGLVPVENSLQGGIMETLDAFLMSASARICAEVLIAVHHNLLAKEPWDRIKRIASKPEVFAQCRNWISSAAKGATWSRPRAPAARRNSPHRKQESPRSGRSSPASCTGCTCCSRTSRTVRTTSRASS